jgi:anamorsin
MAPSVDFSSDFSPAAASPTKTSSSTRTLLLAPPSTSSHESLLRGVMASHDRAATDLQMLDRLSAGLVSLPDATYDLVLLLSDADGTRTESSQLLSREVFARIVQALRAGGKLQTQGGPFSNGEELREAILAGLVAEGDVMVKPDGSANDAVPLRLRRKDKSGAVSNAGPAVATATVAIHGKRKSVDMTPTKPAGVGFVDFSDDFDDLGEEDDELIDEDTLLTEADLKMPVNIRMSTPLPPHILYN